MNTTPTSLSLDRFDLLPPSFRYQNRVRQVFCSWLTVVCALVAILCGVTAATILRMHRQHQRYQQIAVTALPLMDLRQNVLQVQQENDQRDQWCRQIQAARPADGVLQTLAAVTAASQDDDQQIVIDSLELRLPIESPAAASGTPQWAMPQLQIHAHVPSLALHPWLDRLNRSDRVDQAEIVPTDYSRSTTAATVESDSIGLSAQPIHVTATPVATRVLP